MEVSETRFPVESRTLRASKSNISCGSKMKAGEEDSTITLNLTSDQDKM